MKKLFVCTDIHGFFDEWMKALKDARFDSSNPDHILVHCGDLLDRGKQANQCLKFVNDLPDDRKILIRGNHELLMDDILYKKRYFDQYDFSNGTVGSIEQVTGITEVYGDGRDYLFSIHRAMIDEMRHNESWKKYYESTTMCAEVGPYIFVHGWIPCDTICYATYPPQDGLQYNLNWRDSIYQQWKDATWLNGMNAWAEGVREADSTIVCGHWHTSWGHSKLHGDGDEISRNANFAPFEDEGIIAMDACTAYSKKVNVKVLEVSDGVWEDKKCYW